jgi:hypothetical protein
MPHNSRNWYQSAFDDAASNICQVLGGGRKSLFGLLNTCVTHGWVVQVEPIKPILKAAGAKHLKPIYYKLLSNVAFRFYLRCYTVAAPASLRWSDAE